MAIACPLHAATTGFGKRSSRSASPKPASSMAIAALAAALQDRQVEAAGEASLAPGEHDDPGLALRRCPAHAPSSASICGDSTLTLPSSIVSVAIESSHR